MNNILQKKIHPLSAWVIIISFTSISIILPFAGIGKFTNLIIPLGAFGVAIYLYCRAPLLYIGFTWWIWFLSPLFRRLVDYRIGFTDPSPILLAPLLTTSITFITLWQYLFKTNSKQCLPYKLAFLGIVYAFLVGLIYQPLFKVIVSCIEWIAPLSFSFYLLINWRNYPQYRNTIQQVFIWGGLILGVYGVIQYLVVPEWDRIWLIQSEFASAGKPEPFEIRVFSTFYSPKPFGTVMMTFLLVMITSSNKLTIPGNIAGYLSFLLCINRVAWGSWLVGIFCLWNSLKEKSQIKLIITIFSLGLLLFFIANLEPFTDRINSRFETFSDLENDGSALARIDTYSRLSGLAILSFFGEGLGKKIVGLDSGILSMLFSFGWFGTSLYLGGLLFLIVIIWKNLYNNNDIFLLSARGIATAIIAQIPFGGVTSAEQGMLFWSFLGITLSGINYYQNIKKRTVFN